jgi:4-hydroxybutyryl-CoA dehydratase / vinylacetyl-CoA-Delta-isomerase
MLTGQQYLESLRDGRKIYVNGHAVPDVTTEPLLNRGALWAAQGYDKFYDPAPDAHGPYFFIPTSADELRAQQYRQMHWDFPTTSTANGLLMVLTAASRMRADYPVYADRAEAYFQDSTRRDIRSVVTITDAKGDRMLSPGKQDDPDFYTRIVERREDGIVIRGAKLHIHAAGGGGLRSGVRGAGERAGRANRQRHVRAAPGLRPGLLPVQQQVPHV